MYTIIIIIYLTNISKHNERHFNNTRIRKREEKKKNLCECSAKCLFQRNEERSYITKNRRRLKRLINFTCRVNLAKINLLGKQAVHCDRSCCYLKLSSKQQHPVFDESGCASENEYFYGIKVVTRHTSIQPLRDQ